MERLTNECWRNLDLWECCGQDYYCTRGCYEEGGCNKGCIVPKIYDRLAAYEDTGLEPEEIAGLCEIDRRSRMAKMLRWEEAEQDGRLVMLPCKVGGKAHWVHNGTITDCKISRIQINRNGLYICLRSKVSHGAFRIESIGKTVFLTREEAEAALDAQKGSAE